MLFFRHWYSKTPFDELKLNPLHDLSETVAELKQRGFLVRLGQTFLGSSSVTACFIIDKTSGHFVVGCDATENYIHRAEKAFTEAVINLYLGDLKISSEEQIDNINKNGVDSLQSHRAYWRYIKPIPDWCFSKNIDTTKAHNNDEGPFTVKILLKKPIFVVSAKNSALIDLSLGAPTQEKLSLIKNKQLKINDLGDERIHPIP